MLLDEDLARHPHYAPKIRTIAEYVASRCSSLEAASSSFTDADTFQLPNEIETREWIQGLNLQRASFPGA